MPYIFLSQETKTTREHSPNTTYNYNSGATHLLSLIIEKHTGKSTMEFAKTYLFDKLQITNYSWKKRKDGYYDTAGFGLAMQPLGLLKIGQLVLGKGRFKGEQIVSEQWVNKLIDPSLKAATRWGIRKSSHGYCWYHATIDGTEVIYAMGYGGQFIMLLPTQDLIIVSAFNHDTPDGIEQQVEFLRKNLGNIMRRTAT